ncbi:MAG: prolyl oligopeptidase family serine peptidase [Prochloraceae cyanobacterium]|nr:prolyl oligopeptidase family serine peptidase [Prochloraceae cyanobacterium]
MNLTQFNLSYPQSPPGHAIDSYGDIQVKDPYRWLEDPNSEATKAWIAAQNKLTFSYLESIPSREKIKNRITKIWNYEKYNIPFQKGKRYFYFKNDGLQNQSVLYTLTSLEAEPKVLIDPNKLSEDGTVSLSGISVSEDGNLIAYGISRSGSDWQEWKVRDVETGKDLADRIEWVKFSRASWTKDNRGFFYSRYDEPNESTKLEDTNFYQKLYYHSLGTPQSEDVLIYDRQDKKEWGFSGKVSDDGSYLIISVWRGTESKNLIFYKDLRDRNSQVRELISEFEAYYSFIDNEGDTFWFVTNLNAPKDRLIAIDLKNPEGENWQEIIPEAEETIQTVSLVNNKFIVNYLKDARSLIKIFSIDGALIRELELPGIGSVGGFNGKRSDKETFYSFTSFTAPNTIYKYNLETNQNEIFRQPKVDFNPENYEVKQIFYNSKDGTKIPMFITHKKGLKLDGNNPTLLYGYGGFNVSLTPNFSIANLVWMEMGGVYAVPNIRGGGEYGEAWHQAGMKHNKQNVFDDFIAAAEWLIKNNYTNNKKIAIFGGSNGGLLVGACLTQRPELFGAALPAVGVLDMLRFDKFTIGWAWRSEYGDPANPEDFKTLYAYSPLHNIQPGTSYPPTLVITADTDDRVVPAHSFKFTAALQAAQAGNNPILIRIDTKAGHGAGTPTDKIIEAVADRFAFLTRVLDFNY